MPDSQEIYWNSTSVGLIHNPSVDNFFFSGRFEPARNVTSALFREAVEGEKEPIVVIGDGKPTLKAYCMSIESGEIELRLILNSPD